MAVATFAFMVRQSLYKSSTKEKFLAQYSPVLPPKLDLAFSTRLKEIEKPAEPQPE